MPFAWEGARTSSRIGSGCTRSPPISGRRLPPPAADWGRGGPRPAGTRDTRYPRVTLEEVVERAPAAVLLPDEPHPFSAADGDVFRRALPAAKVVRCGGRDFSWYGAQSVDGVPRLRALIDSLR